MATIYRFVFVGFLACFLIAGSPLRSHSGLIGYWSFDEGSGDTVYDSTGNFSPGVIHGAQFTTGKLNSALLFDGVDDYVEVPHDDIIYSSPSGELTIEMWVRIDETKGWIFCKAREPQDVGDIVFEFSGGRLVFGVWSGTWRHTYFNVETHKWYFIAGVIGSDYFSLYVDGELADSQSIPDGLTQNTLNLFFGAHILGMVGYFSGIIDEFRIYNHALTQEEILAHMLGQPSITVTYPNGGEELPVGTSHEITWESSNDIESVRIEYSANNGADWTEIEASTANDGSYGWAIPCDVTTDGLIRISDVDGDPSDVSDAVFSIVDETPPSILISVEKDHLWLPDNRMVDIGFSYEVYDNCDPDPDVSIRITSDEPTVTPPHSTGQKFTPDAAFSDEGGLFLRAEKSRGGDGRVYEVTAIATDASGNSDSGSVLVKVPRSRSRDAVDSGQAYNAETINY